MRLLRPARGTVLVALVLFALGVGSAGLGLAVSNRLSGDEVDPVGRRIGIVRDVERARPSVGRTPGFHPPPIRIKGVLGPHHHSRVWRGWGKPHGAKVIDEKDGAKVIDEKDRD